MPGVRFAPIVVAMLVFAPSRNTVGAEVYELGGMYTFHYRDGRYADWGDYALRGARIAIHEINASGMLGGDALSMKPENVIDYHCWPDDAAVMARTLFEKGILALTGADCSGPAVAIAEVASVYEIPVISNGANASELSDRERFPYFVRVVTPSEAYEGYLVDLAAYFGVNEIACFHTTDAWGLGARRVIHERAEQRGIAILDEEGFARDTPYARILERLRVVRDAGARHIVMTGPTPDTVTLFRALHELGMNRPGYSIYAAEMISADEAPEAVEGSLGYFAPMTYLAPSAELSRFRRALEADLGKPVDPDSKAFFYGALSYDHIFLVAHAIVAAKREGEAVTPRGLMRHLRAADFRGATGRVAIVPGTNDRVDMPIQIFNSHGYRTDGAGGGTVDFVPVAVVEAKTGRLTVDEDAIVWPGGVREPPESRSRPR